MNAERPSYRTAFLKDWMARGLALFFGGFSLLNLINNTRGFDANIWWIDLRFLPSPMDKMLLGIASVLLLWFVIRPATSRGRRWLTAGAAGTISCLAALNVLSFFREWFDGHIAPSFPLPLSLLISASFALIAAAALRSGSYPSGARYQSIIAVFLAAVLLFPLLQLFCFGKTDYRRKADVIVVLGARAYASGEPSDALADRVRTACELYHQGAARKLIFSGGPGDGKIQETEAMRRFAIREGVDPRDVFTDRGGLNTLATVQNTTRMFADLHAQRILVVSHSYHLPRIKMTYQHYGWDVYTVPAKESYFLAETPYMICREVAALWLYYFRQLRNVASASTIQARDVGLL